MRLAVTVLVSFLLPLLTEPASIVRGQTAAPSDAAADAHPAPFLHPGILHTLDDLNRVRSAVQAGTQPWKDAWEAFQKCPLLATDYKPTPRVLAGRDKRTNVGQHELSNDMTAAYYNAIAWYITGHEAYAHKSIEIMDAWSGKCTAIVGSDAVLASGIYGYKAANAAEIIRATYKGWDQKDILQMQHWLKGVWYPVIKGLGDANWGTCCIPTIMSIGVFCDDHAMFTEGVYAYEFGGIGKNLCGVTQYISETGQCGESGRDQTHAQGGIGHLAEAAEIAWSQGMDLYAYKDNRLLKGFEYAAKYNLGLDVPYNPNFHRATMGPWPKISPEKRGLFSPIYEMVWNHYAFRRHVDAPFTQEAALKIMPEPWSVDHPGIGTLLFRLQPTRNGSK